MKADPMIFPQRRLFPVLVLAGALLAAGPAGADAGGPLDRPPDPGAVLDDLSELLDELGRMVDRMPRYALPEVTEDGDIIIRRKDDPGDGREGDGGNEPPPVDPDDVIDL